MLLVIENPSNYTDSTLSSLDYFVSSVFFFEFLCKIYALGFFMHKGSYLRDNWNKLDFFIVVITILDISTSGNPEFAALRALR